MTKISALASLTSLLSDDVLPVVDVHDTTMAATGTTKKLTVAGLLGASVIVPKPTGVTATDTANIAAAVTSLGTALGSGPATLLFQDGTYVIDAGAFVVRNLANFAIKGTGSTVIQLAANRVGQYNTNGDLAVVADCTDFTVRDLRFDWNRDTAAPMTPLTASASSGQPSVTVAAGNGARYLATHRLQLYGGMGTADQAKADTGASGAGMTVQSITAGGGSGGGDLITFTTNLANSYTQISATALSDGLGPYAYAGAYLSPYQTGSNFTAAGRTLGNEDTQNGLHLITCKRFLLAAVDARNTWESPVKCGTGFAATAVTDGCSEGVITGCRVQHGYDQGISVWNCANITVTGNEAKAAGWAGISLSHSQDCTVSANIAVSNIYTPGSDINEGSGIAVEGGVRCVVQGNACSANNSNGIRLNISPMFGGAALSQGVTGSLSAGATAITLSGANASIITGGSYTIIDPSDNKIRETIYTTSVSGTAVTISPALRNAYASGPTIKGRYGEDVLVTGNDCAQSALSAGIKADQQIALKVFANDCSQNGLLAGVFTDTQGTYGIHLHSFCQEAVVEANTCSFNSQEGIVIDNDNQAAQVLSNVSSHNGIKGTNQKMGIKLFGLTDGTVSGNECSYNTHSGIYTQDGNVTTAHLLISGNTCLNNQNAGIWLDNGGTTCTVTGNKIAYSGDAGLKVLGYSNSVFANNECYNQNGQEGIRFDDGNSSRFCTKNIVLGNLLFDDRGGSASQSWGFKDNAGVNSANNTLAYNRTYGNTNAGQLSTAASDTLTGNIIS